MQAAGQRFALPCGSSFFEIVADQQRPAAFAERVDLASLALLAADAAFQIRHQWHDGSSMIAVEKMKKRRSPLRAMVVGVVALVAGLYALCGAGIVLLRWINPWTTTVQMERRIEALHAASSL